MEINTSKESRDVAVTRSRTDRRSVSLRARATTQLAISLSAVVCGVIALPEVGGEYAPLSLFTWCAVAGVFETIGGRVPRVQVLPFIVLALVVTVVVGITGIAATLGVAALIHGGSAMITAMRMPITAQPADAARKDKWSGLDCKAVQDASLKKQPYSGEANESSGTPRREP